MGRTRNKRKLLDETGHSTDDVDAHHPPGGVTDHGDLTGLADDDHTQYLLANGTRELTADWDIGDGRKIEADEIAARDGDGLKLYDDGGNGLFVEDGGQVGWGTTDPRSPVHILVSGTEGTPAPQSGDDLLVIQNTANTTDDAGIALFAGNQALSFIVFGDPENRATGSLNYSHQAGQFDWFVEGVSSFKLTQNGIEIRETTAPTQTANYGKLYVKTSDSLLYFMDDSGTEYGLTGSADHGGLAGLGDDDHTQYALLAGRAGGQSLIGGTAANDDLDLTSTSNATKGLVKVQGGTATEPAWIAGDFFVVRANTSGTMALLTANNTTGTFMFSDNGNRAAGFIQYNHTSNAMILGTNAAARATINSSGNLDVVSTSTQLTLTHTASVDYTNFAVDTNGICTITPSGTRVQIGNASSMDAADDFGVLTAGGQIGFGGLASGSRNWIVTRSGSTMELITIGAADIKIYPNSATGGTILCKGSVAEVWIPPAYTTDLNGQTYRDLLVEDDGTLGYDSSTRRKKTNIRDMEDVGWLMSLRPVNYESKANPTYKRYGLIAEEVEPVNKQLVFHDEDGQVEGVHYKELIPVLLKAIQDLTTRVAELEAA